MGVYQTSLADARASELADVASVCSSSERFVSLVNQAQRRLLRRGNWFSTEQLVRFCIYDRCLTLPRYVATLLGLRHCGCQPAQIFNNWYAIYGPSAHWNSSFVVRDDGQSPTFNSIANPLGSPIRYHVVKANDVGKTITIFGTQFGGQPLQELDANGNWRDGLTITAARPFAQTSVLVTHITSVLREATQGMSYLYEAYDTTTNPVTLRALATYDPGETNPRYRRVRLDNLCMASGCEDAHGRRIIAMEALVKLAFVPVVHDWDFLLIDNMDAMKMMIQAIKKEEANDFQGAQEIIVAACREMNLEDRNLLPKEQTVIEVNSGGRGVINLI